MEQIPVPKTKQQIVKDHVSNMFLHLFLALLTSALLAFPVKWLWNWLMPEIAGTIEISAIQAWGIMFLARLIFATTQTVTKEVKKAER